MSNRVLILVANLGLMLALTIGGPAAAEVVYLNPSGGQFVPVTMPYTGAAPAQATAPAGAWVAAPSSWPWGWSTPTTVPWTTPGTLPAYPVSYAPPTYGMTVYAPAGMTTTGVPATVATTIAMPGTAVASQAPAPGYPSYYTESVIALDRLIAAAETADEIRILLSRPDRLRPIRADNLTRTFLKERMVNAEVARASGLTIEYLGWMFDTLIESGDRLSPSLFLPNFRLLPPASAASWTQIWSRSYAALYTPQVTNRGGLVVVSRATTLRAEASNRSAGLQRLNAGAQVLVAGPAVQVENSAWVMVRTANGFTGWAPAADLSTSFGTLPLGTVPGASALSSQSSIPYSGPESVILWQDPRRVPTGYDSAHGWIHPQFFQNAEAQYPAAPSTNR